MVLKLLKFGCLWSYKRHGLPLELSLYYICIGTCKMWSLTRGGLTREGSPEEGLLIISEGPSEY